MSDTVLEAINAITIIIVSVTCPSLDVSNPLWAPGKEIGNEDDNGSCGQME